MCSSYIKPLINAFIYVCCFVVLILVLGCIIDDSIYLNNVVEICIPFIAGIIGLSVPFGVEMVNKINEKYNSISLVSEFQNECAYHTFICSIVGSILSSVLWVLSSNISFLNDKVSLFPHKLLFVSTLLLFYFLFYFMYTIMVYYKPNELTYKCLRLARIDLASEEYLPVIKDLTIYSVNKNDDKMQAILLHFLEEYTIDRVGDCEIGVSVEYPYEYYRLIYEVEFVKCSTGTVRIANRGSLLNLYFLNEEMEFRLLSRTTYHFIFMGIQQYLQFNLVNLYKSYWEQADNYLSGSISTKDNRIKEGLLEFKDFHFVLGATILENERYDWIKYMFRFTNSEPAHYYLLTRNVEETIELFMRIRADLWGSPIEGFRTYRSFDNEGITGGWEFFKYLQQYVALMFLRLYTLQDHRFYGDPFQEIAIPGSLREKKHWLSNIESFKILIHEVLDEVLHEKVGLPHKDELFNKGRSIDGILDELAKILEKSTLYQLVCEALQDDKVRRPKEKSEELIRQNLDQFEKLFIIDNDIDLDKVDSYTIDVFNDFDRSVFLEGGINHVNYDTNVAQLFIKELNTKLTTQLSRYFRDAVYSLKIGDVLPAIEKILKLKKVSDYTIICFNFSFNSFKETEGLLTGDKYNIVNINAGFHSKLNGLIAVIKSSDKPKIRFAQLDEGLVAKRKFDTPIVDSKCYYSFVDGASEQSNEFGVKKDMVRIAIASKIEVQWKEAIEARFILPIVGYRKNDESPQSLDKVVPFK